MSVRIELKVETESVVYHTIINARATNKHILDNILNALYEESSLDITSYVEITNDKFNKR